MFGNKMFGQEEPETKERPYCKGCADRIGAALAKAEGYEFENNKKEWHTRGATALREIMLIIRDTEMKHDDD